MDRVYNLNRMNKTAQNDIEFNGAESQESSRSAEYRHLSNKNLIMERSLQNVKNLVSSFSDEYSLFKQKVSDVDLDVRIKYGLNSSNRKMEDYLRSILKELAQW